MFAKNIFTFKFVKIYCIHEISYWIIAPRSLRNTDWQKSVVNFELDFGAQLHCSLHDGVKFSLTSTCNRMRRDLFGATQMHRKYLGPFNANICLLLKIYFCLTKAWLRPWLSQTPSIPGKENVKNSSQF